MAVWRLVDDRQIPWGASDKDSVSIGGVNPFRYRWTGSGNGPIVVPDPRDPSKYLHLQVYQIQLGPGQSLIFSAGNLKSSRWLFFEPASLGSPGAFEAGVPKYEGYWRRSRDEASELPWPVPQADWSGRSQFINALMIAETKAEAILHRGFSYCRLCNQVNGHASFRLKIWDWPEGFRHYVVDHEVRPSSAFESFILKNSQWDAL